MWRLASWNVKGLRSPNKRMGVLRHLNKLNVDVTMLQETHLREEDFKRMWGQGRKVGVIIS